MASVTPPGTDVEIQRPYLDFKSHLGAHKWEPSK